MYTPPGKEIGALIESLAESKAMGIKCAGSTSEQHEEIAYAAQSRIHSFRQRGIDVDDNDATVADLTKGLSAQFWDNSEIDSRQLEECRQLAGILLQTYRRVKARSMSGPSMVRP